MCAYNRFTVSTFSVNHVTASSGLLLPDDSIMNSVLENKSNAKTNGIVRVNFSFDFDFDCLDAQWEVLTYCIRSIQMHHS